jgi:hypothetical protein
MRQLENSNSLRNTVALQTSKRRVLWVTTWRVFSHELEKVVIKTLAYSLMQGGTGRAQLVGDKGLTVSWLIKTYKIWQENGKLVRTVKRLVKRRLSLTSCKIFSILRTTLWQPSDKLAIVQTFLKEAQASNVSLNYLQDLTQTNHT